MASRSKFARKLVRARLRAARDLRDMRMGGGEQDAQNRDCLNLGQTLGCSAGHALA
jgi:hypothetical protein